eukprot:CAMPEP_0171240838 /NCGR_PEP_ID=MMETSP0790-20130122/44752_1 /TAXON_ID=2925 /ORGANISM="Alexandrium catenella, Strain OF101" /LENGTH=31 /DNA_ID= /DNA_START= /DNA_END= /DNA_ORIENTATION=
MSPPNTPRPGKKAAQEDNASHQQLRPLVALH